jgi:1-acyl-sn-glycerol-3-phosphate acyltransferase
MPDSETPEQADVEKLADALLSVAEEKANEDPSLADAAADVVQNAISAVRELGIEFVRRYNRLEVDVEPTSLQGPVLFVANHGFGGIFDLNVFATFAALEELSLDRPLTILAHQLTWTIGVGRFLEPFGAVPAGHENANEAFDNGHHVLVYPGGDYDASKSFEDRNQIVFGGRTGFARLALANKVPVVPIVTAGAGESLLVLSSGERLARAMRLDKLLRIKAAPITVSLPWGFSVGTTWLLPYLPLPAKLDTRILAAIPAEENEDAESYAARIQIEMQRALTDMTAHRRTLLGGHEPGARLKGLIRPADST